MCCSGFLKIMMFIFNGGIFLAGAALLGLGIWLKVDSNSLFGLLDNLENVPDQVSQLVYVSYLLIGVGAVLLLIGFLGCCGAMKESRCMLLTFFCIVLIIFLVEVAGAVVLLVFQNVAEDLFKGLEKEMITSIQRQYGDEEGFTSLWDTTMEQFECCGYTNYTNFDDSPFNLKQNLYPTTCCGGGGVANITCTEMNAQNSNVSGCFDMLMEWIETNGTIIAAVALGIVALEIAAMVVSMVLYKNVGSKA